MIILQDGDGNTALHVAVLTQHIQVVSLLMEAGADPTRINFRIVTPIIEAARIGLAA
jgi:ankyrin repeat protein